MDTTCYTFRYIPLHHYPWCSGLRPRPCRISCRQNIYFCLIRRLNRQKYHFPRTKDKRKNSLSVDLLVNLLAQLVEHCTGIAKVMDSNPVRPGFFSGLISTTSSVVFITTRISYIRFFTAVHIYDFHISTIIIPSQYFFFCEKITRVPLSGHLSKRNQAVEVSILFSNKCYGSFYKTLLSIFQLY